MEDVENYIDEPDDIFDGEAIENDAEESNNVANPAEPENPEKVAVPKKRIVRNPRLKFNPDRLCGDRGIPILVNHFKDVKFKGKGHEVEDLDRLLSKLEHWTHRLFPSMKFLDCLKHIEHLGRKRAVQVCVSKIRMDMPILNNDFITQENDDVRRGSDSDTSEVALGTEFDQLMAEYQQTQTAGRNESSDLDSDNDDISPSNSQMSPVPNINEGASVSKELTEEQKQRIEQNRKLAAERLKARQAGLNVSLSDAVNATSSEYQTTQSTSTLTSSQLHNSDVSNEHFHENDNLNNSGIHFKSKTILSDSDDDDISPKRTKKPTVYSDDDEDVDIDDLVENSFQPSRKTFTDDSNSDIPHKKVAQIESGDSDDCIESTEKSKINSNKGTNKNTFNNNLDSQAESSKSQVHQKKRRKIKIDSDDDDSDIELESIKRITTDNSDIDNWENNNFKPPTNQVFANTDSDSDDYNSQVHRKKTKNVKIDSDSDDDDLIISNNETRNKSSFNNVDSDSDSIDILEHRQKTSKKHIINIDDSDSDDAPPLHLKKNRKVVIDSDEDNDNDPVLSDLKPPTNDTDLDSNENDGSKTHFEGNDDMDIKNDSNNDKNDISNAELSDNISKISSSDLSVVIPLVANSQGSENSASVDSELNDTKSRHKQVKRLRIDSDEDSESN